MTTSSQEQTGQPHNGGVRQAAQAKESFAVNRGDDQSMKTASDATRPASGHGGAPTADGTDGGRPEAGRDRGAPGSGQQSATADGNATVRPRSGDRIDGEGVIDRGLSTGGGHDPEREVFRK